MKKIIASVLGLFLFASVAMAQLDLQTGDKPAFKWITPTDHDFSKIPQGIPASTTFEFENTGKVDLVLSNVKPSCGCTTPEYTKEAIAPGKKGYIKATYNAAGMGNFQKSITVSSNVSDQPVVLTIKGEVFGAEKAVEPVATEAVKVAPAPVPTPAAAVVSTPSPVSSASVATVMKSLNVFFGNGSTAISAKDQADLDKLAAEIKAGNQYVLLSGYASKVGKASVNQKLSETRANNVKNSLIKKGINADRIGIQSFGDSAASANQNNDRRVEVQVINR